MARRVLGLDLGTTTGFAILERFSIAHERRALHGTWSCSFRRNVDSPSVRLEKFARHLTKCLTVQCIDTVYYEIVRRHNGTEAAHVYGALKAKMMEVCDAFDTPYVGVDVGAWKKALGCKGNASKVAVYDYVKDVLRYPVTAFSWDEADAIGIARYGVQQ